jgi:hypothetical protein
MHASRNFVIHAGKCWPSLLVIFVLTALTNCRAQTNGKSLLVSAPGSPISVSCGPGNVVAGDLDHDGKTDLVVACAANRLITFFRGRGDGQFTGWGAPLTLPYPPHEIVLGDVDKDGHPDLVVGSHDTYTVLIYHGDGKGNFSGSPDSVIMHSGNQPHTHGLGLGDMNGDGLLDIVTANSNDQDVSVMLNQGRLQFAPAPGSPYAVGPSPYPLTIGDVNNDGHLDIASTSSNRSFKSLTLLIGDGKGSFQRRDVPLRTASPWYVSIGDINHDQLPDLVMTHAERNELTVLTGNKDGQFSEVEQSPFNLGSSAWAIALADLNQDGNPDVLAAANTGVRVMLGNGRGGFTAAQGSPFLTGRGNWRFAVCDVNGDGRPDVVTSNSEANNVSVLLTQ